MDLLRRIWDHFDPKQRYQFLTAAVAYLVLKLGIRIDPVLEGAIAIALGAIAGYVADNGGRGEVGPASDAMLAEQIGNPPR